jgi:gliding motility-associated-like protein
MPGLPHEKSFVFCSLAILLLCSAAKTQCPPNLGFEEGNFNHWECYSGRIDTLGEVKVSLTTPQNDRHTVYMAGRNQAYDPFGNFPVICPNGSGYSVRIGDRDIGAQADRVSYTFTIPATQSTYSVVYNYAVVFQNPGHQRFQQPRFTAKIFDVTSDQYINCSSFDFAASSSLPGFKQVSGTDVFYKTWTPVTIKLSGYAGKTIRLEFTANDCTRGGHFGYAYVDVDEVCGSPIKGTGYCIGTKNITLTAPYGFKGYKWFDENFQQVLGTSNILKLDPAPTVGTKFAVEVQPYPGSGCTDTLYAVITKVDEPFDFRLKDSVGSCDPDLPDLTTSTVTLGSTPGLRYAYYIDSTASEYLLTPSKVDNIGVYYVEASNSFGCNALEPIVVVRSSAPKVNIASPQPVFYPTKVDITDAALVDGDLTGVTVSYWKDPVTSIPLHNANAIEASGVYYIRLENAFGCSKIIPVSVLITPPPPPNVFSPNADGINDVWVITGLQPYPLCTVDIYTRYGQPVFHSTGYNKPWDGTFNGKPLPVGTYYYVITLTRQMKRMSGSITVLR